MTQRLRPILFSLFFLSGGCGLVYQVVWTRMAFASFGIITPVLSVVISVFMLGLGIGSWIGGRNIERWSSAARLSPVLFYALAEVIIGVGAFVVPVLFKAGEQWLLASGQANSTGYLALSAVVLAASILPWCVCMGTTFPFMMAFLRQKEKQSPESFSYLYVANVLGAMAGAVATAVVFVELFGFRDTLRLAAAANFLIAITGLWLVRNELGVRAAEAAVPVVPASARKPLPAAVSQRVDGAAWIKAVLFTTGFLSLAMEVVWTRAFAPVLKTQVYSFAMVVAAYLGATFAGSVLYRRDYRLSRTRSSAEIIGWLCIAALVPVLANDTRWVTAVWWNPKPHAMSVLLLLASICPFCAALGYLTPSLIDKYSGGAPGRAGAAYAINLAGCILGPLFASYVLLPFVNERHALVILSLPLFVFLIASRPQLQRPLLLKLGAGAVAALVLATFWSQSFEDEVRHDSIKTISRRDYAASVVAFENEQQKGLLVNGFGMTKLTPITKCMAHLPLAFHQSPPQSALVICFGMGTSYRSALSWDVKTTVVELVPGVVDVFEFFYDDARQVRANPKGHIVIDDGRRFLARSRERFDVILVDPPPPVECAGSSLLYSKEFYVAAKRRLSEDGIIQAWIPQQEMGVEAAALRSLCEVFPYVRCFRSLEGWGLHMLASNRPLVGDPAELFARMPEPARKDLMEWDPTHTADSYLKILFSREVPPNAILEAHPEVRITDDEPYNEYYLLRHGKGF